MRDRTWKAIATALIVAAAVAGPVAPAGAAPPNDECASATVIPSLPFTETIDVSTATGNPTDPPVCGEGPFPQSVWYQYTAPTAQIVGLTIDGTFEPVAGSIFTGTCGALVDASECRQFLQ